MAKIVLTGGFLKRMSRTPLYLMDVLLDVRSSSRTCWAIINVLPQNHTRNVCTSTYIWQHYGYYLKQIPMATQMKCCHFHASPQTRIADFSSIPIDQDLDREHDLILKDASHEAFSRMIYSVPGAGHRIVLIQPNIKSGPGIKRTVNIEHQISEAVSLIETLHNWKVVDKIILGTKNISQKQVFGSGNAEKLKERVYGNLQVSAAFININMLTGLQHSELETLLGVPIFDRYSIVLQIFKDHAKTRVAKLQVALAEVPYMRSRLKWFHLGGKDRQSGGMQHIGGAGETFMETRRRLLFERETKLKEMLKKVQKQRQIVRKSREKKEVAAVAVVGYTNAGKTSLIKILTGDKDLHPVDQLFATLDVTAHGGLLSSSLPVIYTDTVGFISDIPTTLVDAFRATLEDISRSDLIIHIRDISRPDTEQQKECVINTLKDMNLPNKLTDNLIEVRNKMDLISDPEAHQPHNNCVYVSSTLGIGIADLQYIIENKLLEITDREKRTFRVPNGGDAARWLYKESAVKSVIPDENPEFLLIDVIIGKSSLNKFIHYFGNLEIINK